MERTFSQKIFSLAWKAGLAIVLLFVVYTWVALSWSYAEGERAGYLDKLSRKGWICKTWEGELAMVNLPGATPERFFFTVRDDAVADKVTSMLGKRVSLTYEQHVGIPTSCFGDTNYFVTDVREVEASPAPTAKVPEISKEN